MERKPAQSIIALIVILGIASLVAWGGSQSSAMAYGYPVFAICAVIAFAINWIVFLPSNIAQSEKYYDLTGSLTYLSIIGAAALFSGQMDARSQLAAAMVVVWAVRLGTFLFIRINQDGHDDRFDDIKIKTLRFFTAWTIQGLWALLTAACALAIITSSNKVELGMIGKAGAIVWLLGFVIEVVADRQKRAFRKNPENKGKFINIGLWSWSRHPNYFGEMVIWVGMAIMAVPVLSGWQFICLISPVFVIFLLTKVSGIPLLQKKGMEKWGENSDYLAYLENTSLLIPLPPKGRK